MSVQRLAAWVSSAAVLAAVVAGLVILGSPAEQRSKRLDERRVSDLQALTRALDAYWSERGTLPEETARLLDGRLLSRMPADPVSGLNYPYRKLSASSYELCADFERALREEDEQSFWAHPTGRHCYEFEVGRAGGPELDEVDVSAYLESAGAI